MTNLSGENRAFLFPAMGGKPCGHEKLFYRRHTQRMMPYLAVAGDIARTDFVYALIADKTSELSDLDSQIFTYAYSCAMSLVLREHGLQPGCAAGYSMGIYAALHCAGVLSFIDGLKVLRTAYRLMTAACEGEHYAMAAIVGLRTPETAAVIAALGATSIRIANINSDTCQVVAGKEADMNRFMDAVREQGALMVEKFAVAIPYHHASLAPATKGIELEAAQVHWREPVIPLISAVDQQVLMNAGGCARYTARNLSTPLDWKSTMEKFHRMEISQFIECGPGTTLSRNARFLSFEPDMINLHSIHRRFSI